MSEEKFYAGEKVEFKIHVIEKGGLQEAWWTGVIKSIYYPDEIAEVMYVDLLTKQTATKTMIFSNLKKKQRLLYTTVILPK